MSFEIHCHSSLLEFDEGKYRKAKAIDEETELGLERQCKRCLEFFPLDNEFFFIKKKSISGISYQHQCKACYKEQYYPRRNIARLKKKYSEVQDD